jgi:hypothetical protein
LLPEGFVLNCIVTNCTNYTAYAFSCATGWKVAGSIPDGVLGIIYWHHPSDRTWAPGSTQPLTEMSIKNIFWRVKMTGAWGWQPYHLHMPTVKKFCDLQPLGIHRACNRLA